MTVKILMMCIGGSEVGGEGKEGKVMLESFLFFPKKHTLNVIRPVLVSHNFLRGQESEIPIGCGRLQK